MKFKLKIETEALPEMRALAPILKTLAHQLEEQRPYEVANCEGCVVDAVGGTIGRWTWDLHADEVLDPEVEKALLQNCELRLQVERLTRQLKHLVEQRNEALSENVLLVQQLGMVR